MPIHTGQLRRLRRTLEDARQALLPPEPKPGERVGVRPQKPGARVSAAAGPVTKTKGFRSIEIGDQPVRLRARSWGF